MIIPLGNAITDNNFELSKFYKEGKSNNIDNLIFRKVDENISNGKNQNRVMNILLLRL